MMERSAPPLLRFFEKRDIGGEQPDWIAARQTAYAKRTLGAYACLCSRAH
jgi:hypothetical protein